MKKQNRKKTNTVVQMQKNQNQSNNDELMRVTISKGGNEGEFSINTKCTESVKITDAMEYLCQAVVDTTINSVLANPNTEVVNSYMVKNAIMEFMNEKCNDMIIRMQAASEPNEEVEGDE